MDADPDLDVLRRKLLLHRDRGLDRRERAREHAHAPVAEALHDRAAEGAVVAIEGADVPLTLVEREPLGGLDQRRVADHVGEHGDQPAIEPVAHGTSLFQQAMGASRT